MMCMVIYATDGIVTQKAKLKPNIQRREAEEIMIEMFADDYLGLSYYLEDDDGNEVLALVQ